MIPNIQNSSLRDPCQRNGGHVLVCQLGPVFQQLRQPGRSRRDQLEILYCILLLVGVRACRRLFRKLPSELKFKNKY